MKHKRIPRHLIRKLSNDRLKSECKKAREFSYKVDKYLFLLEDEIYKRFK